MRLVSTDGAITRALNFQTSYDAPMIQLGTIINATGTTYETTSNVANWGSCELMAVSWVGATTLLPGRVVHWDKNFRITATAAASSEINTGKPFGIVVTNFAVGTTTEQYGWIIISGFTPAIYAVAATTGAVYAGTAGTFTPTATNGGQLLNCTCVIAAVSTFTKTGLTTTGSSVVKFGNVGGMYPGQAISGTGIPASSVISRLLQDGMGVEIGSAVGTLVTATASGSVTCTFTNTGYGIVQMYRPCIQSQAV